MIFTKTVPYRGDDRIFLYTCNGFYSMIWPDSAQFSTRVKEINFFFFFFAYENNFED